MNNTRKNHKLMAKKVKKLSDMQLYQFISKMCQNYADDVIAEGLKVLNSEFKFGKQRQEKFLSELNKRLKGEDKDE
jgi:hypothetical protein